ncbi:MAG TPA: sensor histidine kinase [Anaerolineales bacterium]|nr:sensor histidine kinase [Anaerolineales bacterium]
MPREKGAELTPLEIFLQSTHSELDQVRMEMKEIGLLVEQSQGEVDKLANRNASITATLHQLQAHFDTVPREDIKSAYEAAQDAQQRLFTMRGQLEKLQSDQAHLKRYADFVTRTLQLLEGGSAPVVSDQGLASPVVQIIEAQEEERRKLSRKVHDGPAQSLSNFILNAEIALRLMDTDPEKAREELKNLKSTATTTFSSVRDFIFELRPMMLDDLGLVPTVRRYIESYKERSGLDASLLITGKEQRVQSHLEVLVFRAVQELLANAREHAQATQVKAALDVDSTQVKVSVEDNGKGFDPEGAAFTGGQGRGLKTLKERIGLVGGTMEIASAAGKGTRVSLVVPT